MSEEARVDRLFLRSNCIDCAKVRGEIDFGAVVDDGFRGAHGEELKVYTALSAAAAAELLEKFGLEGREMPVVAAHDGAVIEKAKNVIMHLRRLGAVQD